MKYRKKPVEVEAVQWTMGKKPSKKFPVYPHTGLYGGTLCHCGKTMKEHGQIGHNLSVCPGDWVVKEENGYFYVIKPDIFEKTYEKVISES